MKNILLIAALILSACVSLSAEDNKMKHTFRGVSFSPSVERKIKNITVSIPKACMGRYLDNSTDEYPSAAFMQAPQEQDSTFSLLITVKVVSDKKAGFDKLVKTSRKNDFSSPPDNADIMMKYDKSGADKVLILFGHGNLMGNTANGFYYDAEREETYIITTQLFYSGQFSDDDWFDIIKNLVLLYNSVALAKQ